MSTNSYVNIVDEDGNVKQVRYDDFVRRLFKVENRRDMLTHAVMGIAGEAGELVDAIKKHVIYNKPLDLANVLEELGDLRFYMEALMNQLDITDQNVLQHNANKLATRYKGLTYSDTAAIVRADKQGENNA